MDMRRKVDADEKRAFGSPVRASLRIRKTLV